MAASVREARFSDTTTLSVMRLVEILWTAAVCLILIGLAIGVLSAVQSVSPRKGKERLVAFLCIGIGVCTGASAKLRYQALLPTYELAGQIESAQVRAEGKGHRTAVVIRVGRGQVALDASGMSPYFQAGQLIRVRYQGVTGDILKAHFLSKNGAEIAVFNGTDTWSPYWWIIIGAFVIFAGFKKYRRDPEGTERL